MANKCEYCNKTYSSKGALNKHQKTAKYCLQIQKDLNVIKDEIKVITYHCIYCDKHLTSKENLNNHQRICINKINQELAESKTKNKVNHQALTKWSFPTPGTNQMASSNTGH